MVSLMGSVSFSYVLLLLYHGALIPTSLLSHMMFSMVLLLMGVGLSFKCPFLHQVVVWHTQFNLNDVSHIAWHMLQMGYILNAFCSLFEPYCCLHFTPNDVSWQMDTEGFKHSDNLPYIIEVVDCNDFFLPNDV